MISVCLRNIFLEDFLGWIMYWKAGSTINLQLFVYSSDNKNGFWEVGWFIELCSALCFCQIHHRVIASKWQYAIMYYNFYKAFFISHLEREYVLIIFIRLTTYYQSMDCLLPKIWKNVSKSRFRNKQNEMNWSKFPCEDTRTSK